MATIKIILWKHDQKKDGSFPIAIRITQNRKPRYIFTGKYILEKDWNENQGKIKKSHPNSSRLNNYLLKELTKIDTIALEADSSEKYISSKEIKKKVKNKGRAISFFQFAVKRVESKFMAQVFSVAKPELSIMYNIREYHDWNRFEERDLVIERIKKRRKERASKSRKPGYSFLEEVKKEFVKDTTIYFEDISESFLNNFKIFCISYLEQKTRTVTNQLIFIRTLFNLAIKEKIVDEKFYPFANEKEKIRINSSHKIGFTRSEVSIIENCPLKNWSSIWHARNVWLFAYYFAGIRISDVLELKWTDFVNGRLFYTMNKNEKPLSLKIPNQAKAILKYYKEEKRCKDDFVFPFLKKANPNSQRDIFVKTRNATSLINKYLKRLVDLCGIEKNISNHIARHTFGNIAGDTIHPLMLQKLYRHSDLKTTINYQANFIHKDADEALDSVINS